MTKLYRIKKGRVFAGVCTGLGEYFDVDPVIIRIIWIAAGFFTAGIGALILYFIIALIIPVRPEIDIQ